MIKSYKFHMFEHKCENKTEQKSKKETQNKSTFTHKTTDIGHPSFS